VDALADLEGVVFAEATRQEVNGHD
jgi:hypothetical protein